MTNVRPETATQSGPGPHQGGPIPQKSKHNGWNPADTEKNLWLCSAQHKAQPNSLK